MYFSDALTLDAPRRTSSGFMAVRAKAARVGVYDYLGSEIDPENKHGLRDKGMVKVLRDEATVFDKSAAQSFIGKPITDDHPTEAVTADNWRDHARGTVMGAIRDGDYLAFDLLLTDASAIAKVDAGKRELSNGYSASLEFGDFAAPDGTKCVARQTSIQGNHVALVDRGRAGPECRISDAFARCDANPAAPAALFKDTIMKKIVLDGLQVDLADADAVAAAISKLQDSIARLTTDKAGAETQVATLTTDKASLEAKVVTLEKQLADAKLTPAQLRDAARSFQIVADKAKALGVAVTDAMDEPAIMRAAVTAKLGDTAKDWTDAQFAASFAALTADMKVSDAAPHVHNLAPAPFKDASADLSAARAARNAALSQRHRA